MGKKGKLRKGRQTRRMYLKKSFTSFSEEILIKLGLTNSNIYTNEGIRKSFDSKGD